MKSVFYSQIGLFSRLSFSLLAFSLCLLFSNSVSACHQSSVQLDSIIPVGNEYDIYMTLCIGGGVTGTVQGGDNNTVSFSFGFYSAACTPLCISEFPATIVGDSTGGLLAGFDFGPAPQFPFGTQGNVFYQATTTPLTCVTSTALCGNVHQQCDQYRFRMNAVPDSMRVFGIEGGGNPIAGCYPSPDMLIDFTGLNPGGVCCSDTVPPQITVCPPNDTVALGAGCLTPLSDYTSQASASDNCTASPALSQTPVAGTSMVTPGANPVAILAEDCAGSTANCTFIVFGIDLTPPNAICQNTNVYLNNLGTGTMSAFQIDGGSNDHCGIASRSASQTQFGCNQLGPNSITLTVTDSSSNTSICTSTVTVLDTVPPTASCQAATVTLNGQGMGSLFASQVNDGSSDACGVMGFAASDTFFSCADEGPGNVVVLTVFDGSGNAATCTTTVFVEDANPPTVVCPPDVNVFGGVSGQGCGTTASWTQALPADNCMLASSIPSIPQGSYFNPGTTQVIYTVTDMAGNTGQCSFNVIVTPPAPVMAGFSFAQTGNLEYTFTNSSSFTAVYLNWDFGDGNFSNFLNPVHSYASSGNYTVCLTATDSCTSDTICQSLTVVSNDQAVSQSDVQLYPNPNQGEFFLEFHNPEEGVALIEIYDLLGRRVFEEELEITLSENRHRIKVKDMSAGTYTIIVTTLTGQKVIRLVVD